MRVTHVVGVDPRRRRDVGAAQVAGLGCDGATQRRRAHRAAQAASVPRRDAEVVRVVHCGRRRDGQDGGVTRRMTSLRTALLRTALLMTASLRTALHMAAFHKTLKATLHFWRHALRPCTNQATSERLLPCTGAKRTHCERADGKTHSRLETGQSSKCRFDAREREDRMCSVLRRRYSSRPIIPRSRYSSSRRKSRAAAGRVQEQQARCSSAGRVQER